MHLSKALLDAAFEDHVPASSVKITTADGLAGVRDRRAALGELRKAVERVRGLEKQAASPLFGERRPPEDAEKVGRALLKAAMSLARLKGLGEGAEGEFVKLPAAVGEDASTFDAMGGEKTAVEAASAIRRVVEEAEIVVRPVVAIASRALAKAKPTPETVGLADEEFKRAFNVAGDMRPLYFVYSVGDVEFGAVRARGVRAVAFVSSENMLRFEILAEGVEGLAAKVKRVKALGGEWFRLATFEIDVETGVIYLFLRVGVSVRVVVEPILAKHLSALALTDAGDGGRELNSPDPILHLLYALAVGEAVVRVARVVFTEAGPVVHLESRTSAERVNWLYEELARELAELGVVVGVKELRRMAKAAAVEALGKYAEEVERTAKEARDVEELRNKLAELFDRVVRDAADEYRRTRSKETLWRVVGALVAKKFFAENVDGPVWWTLLLLGDGAVKVRDQELGFSAVPTEAAEAVIHVFARVMGVPLEVQRGKGTAALTRGASRAAVERLFKRLEEAKIGGASAIHFLTAVAEWWLGVGTGGSDPPKLLSLLALRELSAGEEGRWLKAWLLYETAVTPMPETVEKWLKGAWPTFVELSRDPLTGAVDYDIYFERGGVKFKLHTDFTNFLLSCESCGGITEDVLRAVAKALEIKPRLKGGDRGEKRLVLPADVGWAMFLKQWKEYTLYANETGGIYREHLREIVELLDREGVKAVSLRSNGKALEFTGAFRDSVLARLGIEPELSPGEPPSVEYLGGYKFRVSNREVEFGKKVIGKKKEFYTKLTFPSRDEAERFASSLKAIGVYAKIVGDVVKLNRDSLFGLLAAINATPPGLTLLYSSDDFRIYAAMEGGRMRFYFAVKHEGAWRAVEGLYNERGKSIMLYHTERKVLEAVRNAVAKALKKLATEKLGRSAEVGEPKEKVDEKGNVEVYYLKLYDHNLIQFLRHAAERVEAGPADVRLEGRRIVVKAGNVEAEVEFKLLKLHKAERLTADDVAQTLALYKSLKALGVPVKLTLRDVKVDGDAMWALVAVAVERSMPSELPAEVMPGVELLKAYNTGSMKLYIFRVEGVHYYFVVKTENEWRTAGGKYVDRLVMIYGEVARAIAEAINAIYREKGVDRKIEVKYKKGAPYLYLTNTDLELLGLKQP